MKTCAIITASIILLSGCGKADQVASHWTGKPSRVCEAGVIYLQFTSGATVMVDREGKPVPCGQ